MILISVGILLVTALLALLSYRSWRFATGFGVIGTITGCIVGLIQALDVLKDGRIETFRIPWHLPYGSFYIEIDALSAFFLVPIFFLSALAALYGGEYLLHEREKKWLGFPWFFFPLLISSMAIVVIARNGLLFLIAWEVMTLTSYFLVTFDHESEQAKKAGWIYLVAAHLGTAFLLMLFILLSQSKASLDFDQIGAFSPAAANLLFILALIGFGTKSGFIPAHVWLPEAHPAAPSHVSAVMSGVMIKTGIYGILRTLTFLGTPPIWWGWMLIGIGIVSGIFGILFALSQRDLKRLLAYSSVENMGIITLGLGVGLLGLNAGSAFLALLGFSASLLHVLNHALFKGLLFLGAGAVLHGTKTQTIDLLGGLLKKMPGVGLCFLVGSVAIAGLPPLNGFLGEFLIYWGAFKGSMSLSVSHAAPLLGVLAALALIGGFTAACFAKTFGIVFLGEARSEFAKQVHKPGIAMQLPMFLLALGCFGVGLGFGPILKVLTQVIAPYIPLQNTASDVLSLNETLSGVVTIGFGFLAILGMLALLRAIILSKRPVDQTVTWDCGYAFPASRMQYSGSSFVQPITTLFKLLLRTRKRFSLPDGLFPKTAMMHTETPDTWYTGLYRPLFHGILQGFSRLRFFQHGRIQLYVLYIALALLAILVWHLGYSS